MTRIERNGLSGLLVRAAVLAFAAMLFGCALKAPDADALAPTVITAR